MGEINYVSARDIAFLVAEAFFNVNSKYFTDDKNGDEFDWSVPRGGLENEDFKVTKVGEHGGEGQGAEYWYVFRIELKKLGIVTYIKFDGEYDSWSDTYWFDPFFVNPREVMVTVYDAI